MHVGLLSVRHRLGRQARQLCQGRGVHCQSALPPGTLLLLPEMFATGFSMNAQAIAEGIDGPTARYMANLAARHGIYVLGGVVIAADHGQVLATKPCSSIRPEGSCRATRRCSFSL